MATNIIEFRAQLLAERAAVVAAIATIDMNDETARFEAAEASFKTARENHAKVARRWNLVQEKLNRLVFLDDQITTLTPSG